ncbi:MAG: hypothetical protein L0Z53_03555 [Acidobacteriales bacterium]|nr:hypothetical protein [Terriglobales bacterium]
MADDTSKSVTPLEGKTSVDDKMFFEPERLSYQSAEAIVDRIAAQIRPKATEHPPRKLVIIGAPLLADFANLQAAYLGLEGLHREYSTLAEHSGRLMQRLQPQKAALEGLAFDSSLALAQTAPAALLPATNAIGAALGLVSFFREDVAYTGIKTNVDSLAFELALAAKLKALGVKEVFVADLMFVPLAEARQDSLRGRLAAVQEAKASAWANMGPIIGEMIRLESDLDDAVKAKNQSSCDQLSQRLSLLRRNAEPITTPLGRLDQHFAELQNRWNQTDPAAGLSGLARLLRAEAIHQLNPRYLHAKVVSSGGHHRVSRSLLRMIFTGDGLSFAGGAIARWALLNSNGSVEDGGIVVERRHHWPPPRLADPSWLP